MATMPAPFPEDLTVGVIGYGKMAAAMVKGFIKAGLIEPKNVTISNRSETNFPSVRSTGINCTTNNKEVVTKSHVIIVAVKPNGFKAVLNEISSVVTPEKIVMSVAAGISLQSLEQWLPPHAHVIRVMPNTPCLVLCGAAAYSLGSKATQQDGLVVRKLIASSGLCEEVDESQIDAIIGVSGSGPAYMYMAMEAMSDAGVKLGLPRDLALRFAAQTMMGSAKMVLETGSHPAVLKDQVTSPGGTTICAVHVLEENKFRSTLISAVEASANRSKEMMKNK